MEGLIHGVQKEGIIRRKDGNVSIYNVNFAGDSGKNMSTNNTAEYIKEARMKFDSYGSEWKKAYFDEKSGGFNVYHKEHKFSPTGGGGEAEKIVGVMLAKLGKQVEFLDENSYKQGNPDMDFDNATWETKYINEANIETIRSAIKNARKANNVIFYWDKNDKLEDLKDAVIRSIGYFKSQNALNAMPDIFYMNKEGVLKKLFIK